MKRAAARAPRRDLVGGRRPNRRLRVALGLARAMGGAG